MDGKDIKISEAGTKGLVSITVDTVIHEDIDNVWEHWTDPAHIMQWNYASEDWHCPYAENDLRVDGRFRYTMASIDGKMEFDFEGVYTEVNERNTIVYLLGDGRRVHIDFVRQGDDTKLIETFDAEETNPPELQQAGWQAILDNFKHYMENKKNRMSIQ